MSSAEEGGGHSDPEECMGRSSTPGSIMLLTSPGGITRVAAGRGERRVNDEKEAESLEPRPASASEKGSNSSGKDTTGYWKSLQQGRLGSAKDPEVKRAAPLDIARSHQG